jgi:hypothetical protein
MNDFLEKCQTELILMLYGMSNYVDRKVTLIWVCKQGKRNDWSVLRKAICEKEIVYSLVVMLWLYRYVF